jgi:hypothetical protein
LFLLRLGSNIGDISLFSPHCGTIDDLSDVSELERVLSYIGDCASLLCEDQAGDGALYLFGSAWKRGATGLLVDLLSLACGSRLNMGDIGRFFFLLFDEASSTFLRSPVLSI